MSTKRPASAAAAAIAGETRWVRPSRPWRPSKLRFEVEAQRSRGAKLIGVHAEAHRAARLAPIEAGRLEDLVEPFGLGLLLHQARARHDHGADIGIHLLAVDDLRHLAQILDAAIGAGADEHAVERDVGDLLAALQAHIVELALGGLALGLVGDLRGHAARVR